MVLGTNSVFFFSTTSRSGQRDLPVQMLYKTKLPDMAVHSSKQEKGKSWFNINELNRPVPNWGAFEEYNIRGLGKIISTLTQYDESMMAGSIPALIHQTDTAAMTAAIIAVLQHLVAATSLQVDIFPFKKLFDCLCKTTNFLHDPIFFSQPRSAAQSYGLIFRKNLPNLIAKW